MKKCFGVLLTLIYSALLANLEISNLKEHLSGYKGLLEGCIDPVTGSWHDRELDLDIPGSSLNVERVHSSAEPGWLSTRTKIWTSRERPPLNQWARWGWNHSTLFYYIPWEKLVYIQDMGGNNLSFAHDNFRNGALRKEIFLTWNNLHSVGGGARTDAHNFVLSCGPNNRWQVVTPQGTIRQFNKSDFSDGKKIQQVWMCGENERIYPSGIRWRYNYCGENNPRLACMQTSSVEELDREGAVIQSLKFENSGQKIYSQTGDWIEYTLENRKGYPNLLSSTKRSNGPGVSYEYICHTMDWHIRQPGVESIYSTFEHQVPPYVSKKMYEGGKYRRMQYKPFHDMTVGPLSPLTYQDFCGNITGYFGPVGKNGKEEAIYLLEYTPSCTRVRCGDGTVQNYFINSKKMLTKVSESDSLAVKRNRSFKYSEGSFSGRLEREWLNDGLEKSHRLLSFKYDAKGNVVEKTLYGMIRDQTKALVVSKEGNITNESQTDSYTIKYTYGDGPLYLKTSEIHPDGRKETYVYEPGTDKILSKLIWQGEDIIERNYFYYEKHGHIAFEIHDDGTSPDPSNLEGMFHRKIIRRTVFNEGIQKGLLCDEKLAYWDVEKNEEVLCNRVEYAYNDKRRVVVKKSYEYVNGSSFEIRYGYDDHGNVISETNARGALIERRFSIDNCLLWEKGPDPRVEKFYTYDADRRLAKCVEKHSDYTDLEWITKYEYDVMGRVLRLIDPYGVETSYAYDWGGRVVAQTKTGVLNDTSNALTEYRIDCGYDLEDRKIYERDEKGYETHSLFNILGKPLYTSSQEGRTEEFFYDSLFRLEKKVYDQGALTEYFYYDSKGNHCRTELAHGDQRYTLLEREYTGSYKSVETDALGHQDLWRYDGLGREIDHQRIDGNTGACSIEQWEYDGWSRILVHRKWQDDASYIESHARYNAAGDVIDQWTQNSEGEKYKYSHFSYDEIGRCLKSAVVFEDQVYEKQFEYDSLGNPSLQVDEEGYQTKWRYIYQPGRRDDGIAVIAHQVRKDDSCKESLLSASGLEISQKLFDSSGQLSQHQLFGYNCSDQLVFRKERAIPSAVHDGSAHTSDWVQTKLDYGPGKLVSKRWDNYQGPLERLRSWEYNSRGHCLKKTEPSGLVHEYTYDARGFLTRCTCSDNSIDYTYQYDLLGRLITARNHLTEKVTFRSYDAWGRVIRDESEEGNVFEREWNALGQPVRDVYPSKVEVSREYKGGLLRRTYTKGLEQKIEKYDSASHAVLEKQPNELGFITSCFDVKDRLNSLESVGYRASQVQYDAMGNLTSRLVNEEWLQRYEYDSLGQLKHEMGTKENIYLCDSRYRRLSKNDESISLDDLDQIFAIQKNEGAESCEYDLDGHLLKRAFAGQTLEYKYDGWSRLIQIKGPDFESTYTYDAFNRRMSAHQKIGGITEFRKFGYLGQMLACVTLSDQRDERYFVRATASERGDTFAWVHGAEVYMPIHDMSGSCIGWRDLQGSQISRWSYDSFGNVLGESFGLWGFWGKYKDPVTGMIYFGLRDYIPEEGRWLTRDPKGEIDSSNLYAFVGNNPVTRCDEWGAEWSWLENKSLLDVFCCFVYSSIYPGWTSHTRDANDDIAKGNLSAEASCVIIASYQGENRSDSGPAIKVNGNANTYREAVYDAQKACNDLQSDVYYVYNFSACEKFPFVIGMALDASRALLQRNGVNFHTGSELACRQAFDLADKAQPDKPILGQPHSHGMQVLTNTERAFRDDSRMGRVFLKTHVSAMAGSGHAENYKNFGSFKNTVCTNDLYIRCLDGGAIAKQREAGILKEPEPVMAPDAGWWEKIRSCVNPDHYLNGPTCQSVYQDTIDDWKRK